MTWIQDGQTPQQFFDTAWPELSDAVLLILGNIESSTQLSFQELYSKVYQICISQMSKTVYQELGNTVTTYLEKCSENSEFQNLESFYKFWSDFVEKVKVVTSFFLYLDRVYSTGISIPQCYDMCLLKFRDHAVLKHIESLKKDIGECVKSVRDGSFENTSLDNGNKLELSTNSKKLVMSVFEMLQLLDLFGNTTVFHYHVEPYLLQESRAYYERLADRNIQSMSSSEYIEAIYQIFDIEKRVNNEITTDMDYHIKMEKVIYELFITQKREQFVSSCFKNFINTKNYEDIVKIMDLFNKEDENMDYLMSVFAKDCSQSFLEIQEDSALPRKKQQTKWIQDFLDISKDYNVLIEHLSSMKTQMLTHVNEGISQAINQQSNKSAEYLSQYFDFFLRSETKWDENMSSFNVFDKTIVRCIRLLQLIKEQDVFEVFYKQQLSKRLLQRRSNLEAEKHVLIKMKDALGSNFTAKLESMVHDIVSSLTDNKKFNNSPNYAHPFELEASILTNTCWPFQNTQIFAEEEKTLAVPQELMKYGLDYENCYIKTHEGRKITWAYPYGFLDIGYQFNKTYHVINMPFYAGLIFLLFEEHQQLTTREIKDLTSIPSNEVVRQLASMALAPKTRILRKTPMTKSVKDSDVFSVNEDFTAETESVKLVLAIISKSSNKEAQA
ncbi:hypothetical protein ACO0QE_004676 [Hanseniaspora vineae]